MTDDAWTSERAAHLARRAGFGAKPDELASLVDMGRDAAIEYFLDFPQEDEALQADIQDIGGRLSDIEFGAEWVGPESIYEIADSVRSWWLYRMVQGRHPLREKLTLLWHDHFACQQSKIIRLDQYLFQNKTYRRHAAGSFRDLLREVAEDPGMLMYLDNRLNEKANPNENWGRELLELFTLGVDKGYVQKDVWELSRVFTGWTTPDINSAEFVFDANTHDETDKQVLGSTIRGRSGAEGVEEGQEALDLILARPECAPFIASKLLSWFVAHEPPHEQVQAFGNILRTNDYSIREMLRALFRSDWFYAEENRLTAFRNPVDFVVSAARLLGIQNAHTFAFHEHTRLMGMNLFEPPSVAGWQHGATWVNSASTVHRYNFALELSNLSHSSRSVSGRTAFDLDELGAHDTHESLVDAVAERLLQRPLAQRDAVVACLDETAGLLSPELSERSRRRALTRTTIHLMLTTPEFTLA